MSDTVQLVFFGEVVEGHAPDDVKRTLGQLFKLDDARVAQMFSGARVVINRAVATADAPEHVARFARLGARLHIEAAAATAAPLPPLSASPAPSPAPQLAAAVMAAPPAAIEEEIVCPNCGERQSKRLLCRACATNMPMGIAAKLEAEQHKRAEAQAARPDRRGGTASSRPRAASNAPGTGLLGVGFDGRVGRLAYATAGALLMAAMFALAAFLVRQPGFGRLAVFLVGLLVILFVSVRLTVLRCHDCNRSGWWSLLVAVPYLGTVASLLLSFMPGTAQANDHGEPPAAGSWPVLLGSLAVLAVTLVMSYSALSSAMLAGGTMAEAEVPGAPADAGPLSLLAPAARSAFVGEYMSGPGHKAFAISPGGAWGWKSGAESADAAVQAALATCTANRQSYTPECAPVHVDGEWLLKAP